MRLFPLIVWTGNNKDMKVYTLKRKQFLPISMEEAWSFFSSPQNLSKITPKHMQFKILDISGKPEMYAGQVIKYNVNVLPNVPVFWMTEITHVDAPHFFVDEQRVGPYTMWHHQHRFEEVDGGVDMEDEVNYALPMGVLGRFAHMVFVENQLNTIFDYRYQILEELFKQEPVVHSH